MSEPSRSAGGSPRQRGALHVGLGILASRLAGFVRDRTIGHFFGLGPHADVFRTALRGPNLLQNLLGEGSISASFIPVYTRLLREGRDEEARRFAGAAFGLLGAVAAALSLAGALLARPIVALLAAGFVGDAAAGAPVDRFELTVRCVRWIFPMTGLLVLSAWALGVLNSHRRFFLSYFAPVLWNLAIVAALFWQGYARHGGDDAVLIGACVGALIGGGLQFAVQLPLVLRLLGGLRPSLSTKPAGVREALRAFGPVVAARGAVQFAAYLDTFLASFLAYGAVGALGNALTLYLLPTALFSASFAAAVLPELASEAERADALRARLDRALQQVAFFNVPTAVAYLGFGFLIVGAVFRTGDFRISESWLVYFALSGLTVGLLAGAFSRLLQNAFYALSDTVTPARTAVLRVVLSAALGGGAMLGLDRVALAADLHLGDPAGRLRLGAVGLALGTGVAAWFEMWTLRRKLASRLQHFGLPWLPVGKMTAAALLAALPAAGVWAALPPLHPLVEAAVVLPVLGVGYVILASAWGVAEAARWTRWVGRRRSGGS
jgi:putative peptidoglycan lipid II flippase